MEKALVQALSRYIGYTAGAYNLGRILSVLEVFQDRPSAIEEELYLFLKDQATLESEATDRKVPTKDYLHEVLNFATSMQILEIVSERTSRIRRFAPTQLGRSLLGVRACQDQEFHRFFLTTVLLQTDADAITPILHFTSRQGSVSDLQDKYIEFHHELRDRRLRWLMEVFPDRRLRSRLIPSLPWVKLQSTSQAVPELAEISKATARHHVTPRREWLSTLELITEDRSELTEFGTAVYTAVMPSQPYFWLGPPEGLQEALGVPTNLVAPGPFSDTLTIGEQTRPPSGQQTDQIIEDTTEVMIATFPGARLIYAPQASLQVPIQYLSYRSYKDQVQYDWTETLAKLFLRKRAVLERLSAVRGAVGFYKVKSERPTRSLM